VAVSAVVDGRAVQYTVPTYTATGLNVALMAMLVLAAVTSTDVMTGANWYKVGMAVEK
jgi:hypothetical protein